MTIAMSELKSIPQWVGHQNKIPKNPYNGRNAQTNNPVTWSNIETAWSAKSRYGWDGVGFVFTISAGIVGIDLDDCFELDGNFKPWARDVAQCLDSYTEYSPSGKGLHIYCRGEIQGSINRSTAGFEMYNELRYFTVTGRAYGNNNKPIAERTKELQALYVVFSDNQPVIKKESSFTASPNLADVKKAIQYIPPHGDYYDWLKVLMAVHDADPGSEGIAICESWSPGYKGEIERKFESFDRTSKNGVTVATLFHMAKENGYQQQSTKKISSTKKTLREMYNDR